MPKIVDHDARRAELAAACWLVIARQGIAHTTTREIAKEAGVAHGVLAHYFADKDAILREALRLAYLRLAAHIRARIDGLAGAAALRTALVESLPLDEERRLGDQIELAFWGRAVGDPELAAERLVTYDEWRAVLHDLVRAAHEAGEMPGADEPGTVADALVAIVDGLGAEAALYPERFPAERQTRVIDGVLGAYGVDVTAAARTADATAP